MANPTIKLITKIVFLMVLGMLAGVLMNQVFTDQLNELAEIRASDVIGVLGTIYALITAFVLVNVWTDFNDTNTSLGIENEAIISLWNNVDYLEDEKVSEEMNAALTNYLEQVIKHEIPSQRKGQRVVFPSTEFISILKTIDKVKFDDQRDPIVFEALISSYKSLSKARNDRIVNINNRIPMVLLGFYLFASIAFWGGYLIEGFDSELLYYLTLFTVTLISTLSYAIIKDLDDTLDGVLQIDFSRYDESLEYVKSTQHEIFKD